MRSITSETHDQLVHETPEQFFARLLQESQALRLCMKRRDPRQMTFSIPGPKPEVLKATTVGDWRMFYAAACSDKPEGRGFRRVR